MGRSHYELYTRLAQKIAGLLTAPTQFGNLYEIDHRLRPFGVKGVLVPTLAAFTGFAREAEVWNFQAFTRLRLICGEQKLEREVVSAVAEAWRSAPHTRSQVSQAVRAMLGRLVSEHAPSTKAGTLLPLRYAVGGMIGFEFLAQCRFLLAAKESGGTWTAPPEEGRIRELRPAYDTISALDERLSFHLPGAKSAARHEVAPEHFRELAALASHWKFDDIQELAQGLEAGVEAGFREAGAQ